ncbi:MAG: glycerol-3-phosphate 1-O-acyltransferase PlsY [Clostridia bacterium]|nr:glycerol-3-phosphate 1-O-acyltransferase PlsY [Clostridia bacterium]
MKILEYGLISILTNAFEISNTDVRKLIWFGLLLLTISISYVLGSLSSAIIVSRAMFNEDIRNHGSKNAGLTNMLRTYGKGAAIMTLAGDMLKTALAIFITALFFGLSGSYYSGICINGIFYLAGVAAVLGHVFPVFYGFKGGKGVLVTATLALILSPIVFVTLLVIFILIVVFTRFVSLGSICVAAMFPASVCLYSHFKAGRVSTLTIISTIFLAIFIIWCHRGNIKRLLAGNEKKISIGSREKKD